MLTKYNSPTGVFQEHVHLIWLIFSFASSSDIGDFCGLAQDKFDPRYIQVEVKLMGGKAIAMISQWKKPLFPFSPSMDSLALGLWTIRTSTINKNSIGMFNKLMKIPRLGHMPHIDIKYRPSGLSRYYKQHYFLEDLIVV